MARSIGAIHRRVLGDTGTSQRWRAVLSTCPVSTCPVLFDQWLSGFPHHHQQFNYDVVRSLPFGPLQLDMRTGGCVRYDRPGNRTKDLPRRYLQSLQQSADRSYLVLRLVAGPWSTCACWAMVHLHLLGHGPLALAGPWSTCTCWAMVHLHLLGHGPLALAGPWSTCTWWAMVHLHLLGHGPLALHWFSGNYRQSSIVCGWSKSIWR